MEKLEDSLNRGNQPKLNEVPDLTQDHGTDLEKNEPLRSNRKQQETAEEQNAFLVRFNEGDPENPKNFNPYFKAWLTFEMGMLAFTSSLGSSIIAPAEATIADHMNISLEVTVLMVALFVLGLRDQSLNSGMQVTLAGFAFGPLVWAPIGEVYGRKWSILPAVFVLGLFSIGTATSKNAASIFITRFLGGVFGSAPVGNVSAALGDIYAPRTRGIAMAFMAMCVVGGPTIAPVIGAALTVNPHLGWRWTEYVEAILVYTIWTVAFFGMPETYAPVLLKRKAQRMRKSTGIQHYWHPHEKEEINLSNVFTKHLSRPLWMFFTEPMVTCIALYASFVYGLLFLTLEVFPIVFEEEHQYGPVVSTLPFLGLFVGVLFAMLINIANQPRYIRTIEKNNGRAVPEARLPPMIIGGVLFSTGLFWFGWTAAPRYSWVSPVIAAGFIGAGFNIVFQQCLNYLVDTYGPYAASAISANTFLRSLLACGLPMAARPMFLNMGVGPASSLLGAISCLALPVPFIFMKYGLKLRKMSKFAPVVED